MLLRTFVCFQVPDPVVKVYAIRSPVVGQPLTLECNVTTVRGITSRVDIVWSRNDVELKRIEGIQSNLIYDNSVIYVDSYTINRLGTVDANRTYECAVVINQALPITVNDGINLDVMSKFCIH